MIRPFLKWPGNKYSVIDHIKRSLPKASRLIEPFVGSGAVFLNTHYSRYLLTDVNADLIQLYCFLQTEGRTFIEFSQTIFNGKNTPDDYYQARELFNTTSDLRLKAALFLYLNKHGFNGLCRYNLQGKYNVPFGRYKKPYFPEKEMLVFHQKAQEAIFKKMDFRATMAIARPGDVLYCDPPYAPLSKTANFTHYSTSRFGEAEQITLAKSAEALAEQGVVVLISNHQTPFVKMLYARAKIRRFKVKRTISCQAHNRNKVSELLAIFS